MDSSFKGLFSFSKKEQIGLIFFLLIIVLCLLAIRFQNLIFPIPEPKAVVLDSAWLATMDSLHQEKENYTASRPAKSKSKFKLNKPFAFDPNTISIADLVHLGFSQKQSESIDRYRSKGGKFKKKSDFKKMYVVNDFMYDRLESFIQIEELSISERESFSKSKENAVNKVQEVDIITMLELNSADSVQLESLPGIGPIFAQRILKYRDILGGYNSVEQLKEVYGMDRHPEVFEIMKPYLFISSEVQRPIDVNSAQWVDLVRHPYIEKPIANSIIAIREQHGPYKSIEEIKRSHLISEDLYRKLEPYLIVSQ